MLSLIKNLASSAVDKAFTLVCQLAVIIIIVRTLGFEGYAVYSITISTTVFLAILDIHFSSIIIKDHKEYDTRISDIMSEFFSANIAKISILFIFYVLVGVCLYIVKKNNDYLILIIGLSALNLVTSLCAPFVYYYSSQFQQHKITMINMVRNLVVLIGSLPLFLNESLLVLFFRDIAVASIYGLCWYFVLRADNKLLIRIAAPNYNFILDTIKSYSIWGHLNGVFSSKIGRAHV